MKKNKSLEKVGKIAEQYGTDKQKQIKELKRLVREGQKSGDLLLVGTAHYYIANAYRSLGEQTRTKP